jgi:excisionase family DNA binding protein
VAYDGLGIVAPVERHDEDGLITVRVAAHQACCSEETVKRAIRSGVLPASRRGKGYAIKQSDLRAWRDAPNTRRSPSPALPSTLPRRKSGPSDIADAWEAIQRQAA